MVKEKNSEEWDFVIRPHRGLFELHLDDLWRYRDMVFLFVRRDFFAQYKQTILGPAWFIIQPLLTTIIFTIIFGNIAQISTDGTPKVLFYLSGNILWLYFSSCLTTSSATFTNNASLFSKVYFPRLAVPVSLIISGLTKFFLQFLFFLCFLVYYMQITEIKMNSSAWLFPLLVFLMAGLSLGMGIIFSSFTTKYRDFNFLLGFGIRLGMYLTPVIFPLSAMPQQYKWFILANPMTPLIETFRHGFLGAGSFSWAYLAYSAGFTVFVLFLGSIIFTRVERTFIDTV